jgi:acyl-CoA synthetase (AMP-forming)/AMP-acid ligase II
MNSILDVLRRRCREGDDRPCLSDGDRQSYAASDILRCVGQLSRRLTAAGVPSDGRVAILLPDDIGLCLAFLGVSGHCAAAPLSPKASEGDLAGWLDDLQPQALLTGRGHGDAAERQALRLGIPVMWFDTEDDTSGPEGDANTPAPGSGDTALILHTSGTTARAKMVPLTHGNLLRSAENIARTLHLGPGDRCLNVMPMFHIHGLVACLLAPLVSGGQIIVAGSQDAGTFFRLLRVTGATWYSAVPTRHAHLLERLATEPGSAGGHALRFIRSSSAALPNRLLEGLEATFGVPVIESYGMTEAAHQMCSNPLPPGIRKAGSVGLPAGPEVAVVDAAGRRLPVGVVGDIVIRGENVTPGYLHLSQERQERLEGGWFRTGDLGHLDADGYLYLQGRAKEIVNRGGEKVSPAEVDARLLTHPAVAEAVSFAVPHPTLGEDLVAAIVMQPGGSDEEAELRAYLFDHLSPHKVPSRILIVDSIPKSSIGKVQRNRLADAWAGLLAHRPAVPASDTERLVMDVFQEVIPGHPYPGREDNFFSLGGDSLHGIRAAQELGARFGIELPGHAIFRYPTPALLGRHIDGLRREVLRKSLVARLGTLTQEQRDALLGP